jgi:hypothetical protein
VKTQIAGRGFTTGYGTSNDVQDATDFVGRLDALTIRENTQRAVLAKKAEAGGYRAEKCQFFCPPRFARSLAPAR